LSATTEQGCDEAVTTSRKCFDEPRTIGGISQSFAESIHGCVQPVLEVNEGVAPPDFFAELFAAYEFTGAF
jgi:hypothetical protein